MTGRDVTAVMLSIGEPFVSRTPASLARPTPPVDVVRVEGISPFHRALNAGVARVRSALLVHVDADRAAADSRSLTDLFADGLGE